MNGPVSTSKGNIWVGTIDSSGPCGFEKSRRPSVGVHVWACLGEMRLMVTEIGGGGSMPHTTWI
jgi:hypothetical protein